MLGNAPLVTFVPVTDLDRAKAFYVGKLGLTVESTNAFALVLRAGGIRVRVTPVGDFAPQPFTVLGWEVASIKAVARQLGALGITFERFEGMAQDDLGIWTSPDGSEVMWFKDPDGNLLSIAEHHAVMPPSATHGSVAAPRT